MKIAIDTRSLETEHRYRGIGTYAENLLKNIALVDVNNDYYFLTNSVPSVAKTILKDTKFKSRDVLIRKTLDPTRYHYVKDQFHVPKALKKSQVQLVHYLDQFSTPMRKVAPTIITVHDLYQFVMGETGLKIKVRLLPLKYADVLIVPSEFSKKELIRYFHINPEKIRVIPHGFDHEHFRLNKTVKKSPVLGKYLLYVGAIGEERKNLLFLIEVFKEIVKENPGLKLVLVGRSGPGSDKIKGKIKSLGLSQKVVITEFVNDLAPYYQFAEALVFPSLYEGFGLPPLEAMACGIPVISSSATSLSEVVGDGGVLLSPTDKVAWVKNISKILSDTGYRERLIKKGLIQAQKFSWEKSAKETIKVYNEIRKRRK